MTKFFDHFVYGRRSKATGKGTKMTKFKAMYTIKKCRDIIYVKILNSQEHR